MKHQTTASQRIEAMPYASSDHEYKKDDLVITCDGLPGRIVGVHDGPFRGNEEYEIVLENDLGRGTYTSSQIKGRFIEDSDPNIFTADKDYPELHDILRQRPDPAKLRFSASLSAEIDSAELSPLSKVIAHGASNSSFRRHLTAAWKDVVAKAKKIRSESGVTIVSASGDTVIGHVKGETNVYETGIQRVVGGQSIAAWSCGCAWGAYHWGAPDDFSRFAGRMCSHALALQYEAQSRGMFGRDIREDDTKPKWVPKRVVVKYDPDSGEHLRAQSNWGGEVKDDPSLALPPIVIIAHMAQYDEQAKRIMKSAAVNDLFGNNPTILPNTDVSPLGATSPRNPQENPASSGPLSGPDPADWMSVQPTQLNTWAAFDQSSTEINGDTPPIDNVTPDESEFSINQTPHGNIVHATAGELDAEGELKDEPEGAVPETTAFNWDQADPSALSPEQIDSNGTPTPPSGGVMTSSPIKDDQKIPEETLSGSNTRDTMVDILRDFHKSLGAQVPLNKEALKNFSFHEQQELINEGRGQRARNFDRLDIEGTHYALIDEENEDQLWLV